MSAAAWSPHGSSRHLTQITTCLMWEYQYGTMLSLAMPRHQVLWPLLPHRATGSITAHLLALMTAMPNQEVISPCKRIHSRRSESLGSSDYPEEAIQTTHHPSLSFLPHVGRKVIDAAQLVGNCTVDALGLHPEPGRRRGSLRRRPLLKSASPSAAFRLCAQLCILSEPTARRGQSQRVFEVSEGAGRPSPG